MRKTYNKLVRDRIPEIIAHDGHACRISKLSDNAYLEELKRKLFEEAREALESPTTASLLLELGDVLEVIDATVCAVGASIQQVQELREKRARERGRFERRIFLHYVDDVEPKN